MAMARWSLPRFLANHDTTEQKFALKRQLFLCEQGYEYRIEFSDETV